MTSVARRREETRVLLRSVLLPNKRGLLLSELEKEYRGMTGKNIPYRLLGYPSLLSLLKDMKDVATLQVLSSGHQVVVATPDKSTQHIANMVSCQKDNLEGYNNITGRVLAGRSRIAKTMAEYLQHQTVSMDRKVPGLIKKKLGKLLSKFPSGLLSSQLREKYRELYGEDLDPLSCGQPSVLELCCQVPDIMHIKKVGQGSDWLLIPITVRAEFGANATKRSFDERTKFNGNVTDKSSLSGLSDKVQFQKLPAIVGVGHVLEVMVTRIQSPSKIYVQFGDMQNTLNTITEIVTKEMNEKVEREVRPIEMKEGMIVACMIGSIWYRVIVIRLKDMALVKVFLLDYGIIQTVNISELKYLSLEATQFPAQAIPVSLALPAHKDRWPKEANIRLKEMIIDNQDQGGNIFAKVVRLQEQHKMMEVVLVDQKDMILNDVLVNVYSRGKLGEKETELLHKLASVLQLAEKKLKQNVSDDSINKLEGLITELEVELSSENNSFKVVKFGVENRILHVISWEGRRWCISDEIAEIIKDNWRRGDLLDKMVQCRRMSVDGLVFTKQMSTALWDEMTRMGVMSNDKDDLSFYLLGDVPQLVRAFAIPGSADSKLAKIEDIVTPLQ